MLDHLKGIEPIGCDIVLLDTSAWIELLEDTKNTRRIRTLLESEECHTSIATIAEISNWAAKYNRDSEPIISRISKLSTILAIDNTIAVLAGRLNFERKRNNKKWGMMDSFILATSLIYGLRILVKDPDFSDLQNVEILPNG